MWLWVYFAGMVNIYNQLTSSKGENTWWRGWALSNQLRFLTKTEGFPEKKFCFKTIVSIPTWVFSLLACPMDLTCQLWQLCEAILKIKPYIYPPYTSMHTHMHISHLFCFSGGGWLIQRVVHSGLPARTTEHPLAHLSRKDFIIGHGVAHGNTGKTRGLGSKASCSGTAATAPVQMLLLPPPHTGISDCTSAAEPHYCCPWKLAASTATLARKWIQPGTCFLTYVYLELKSFLCPNSSSKRGWESEFFGLYLGKNQMVGNSPYLGKVFKEAGKTWMVYLNGSIVSVLFCFCGPVP